MKDNMTYQEQKAKAIQSAIDLQNYISQNDCSYGELIMYQDKFEKLGKRYGLLTEFKENGII